MGVKELAFGSVRDPPSGLVCAVRGLPTSGLCEGRVVCILCADVNMCVRVRRGSEFLPGVCLQDPCAF